MKLANNKALLVDSQACLTPTPCSSHCALLPPYGKQKHEQVNKTTLEVRCPQLLVTRRLTKAVKRTLVDNI